MGKFAEFGAERQLQILHRFAVQDDNVEEGLYASHPEINPGTARLAREHLRLDFGLGCGS